MQGWLRSKAVWYRRWRRGMIAGMETPEKRRWFQFRLRTLLILVTAAAILCSAAKAAARFVPIEFLEDVGEFLALTVTIATLPASIIGRKIDRMFDSLYLGTIWGVLIAVFLCLPEILAAGFSLSLLNPAWHIPYRRPPSAR